MDIKTTKKIISSNVTSSIMLHANHGVGKSSCVKQVAKQLGIEFFDIRLSQCDVGDIKGLPYRDGETMKFAKPEWWPRNKDSKGILFFDELNRASKDVLQAVFEICLDRTLDGDKLPDGWKIVSAVNSHSDYDVLELDPALQDRWFHIEFSPTAKEWLDWADGKVCVVKNVLLCFKSLWPMSLSY
jgi:MoxR-like ATPase